MTGSACPPFCAMVLMVGTAQERLCPPYTPRSARLAPVRADRAGNAVEGAVDEFSDQEAAVIHRAGHGRPSLRNRLETDAAVIGFVADQNNQAMALLFRILQRAIEQHAPDA